MCNRDSFCMRIILSSILLFCLLAAPASLFSQDSKTNLSHLSLIDTTQKPAKDSVKQKKTVPAANLFLKKKHDPHKATIRSAIIPGWGQIYNKQYWKLPLVYAAIGIPAGFYVYNNTWYKRTRDAYIIVAAQDTANYGKIYKGLIYPDGTPLDAYSLQSYRNQFRRNRDYSILYFLLAWGLNVVDATVSGHLKDFDISDDLSLHVEPHYNPTIKTAGLGLVFNFKNSSHRLKTEF